MNSIQASNYIKTLFTNYWKTLGYPCYFQNIESKKTVVDQPYARLSIYHTDMARCSYRGTNGKCKYRYSGVVAINLYVPRNKGVEDILQLAENTVAIFRDPPYNCEINFGNCSFMETTNEYSAFFEVNVTIPFDYEYVF